MRCDKHRSFFAAQKHQHSKAPYCLVRVNSNPDPEGKQSFYKQGSMHHQRWMTLDIQKDTV